MSQRSQEIYRLLLQRAPENAIEPDLERMRLIADLTGSPQNAQPIIHLTGTNGKTSTSRIIERLLREMNLRTGRYTSPHLSDVRERIAIDGAPISHERFAEVWDDLQPYLAMVDDQSRDNGGPPMTYFEALTAMAYSAFADAPVDVGVVEVGMGGLWDATNIADAQVAVITSISRDHEKWLGTNLADIAREKAGIIKPGSTVIIGKQREEVEEILLEAAATQGARVLREGVDIAVVDRQLAVGGQMLTLQTTGGVYEGIFLPLLGEHQAHNALLALAAVEQFIGSGGALAADVVEAALGSVTSPGRLELVRSSPTIIVDAAHNPGGASALGAALDEVFGFERTVAVIGMLDDKNAEAFLSELEPVISDVIVTEPASPRSLPLRELAEIARDVFDEDCVHVAARLDDAVDQAATLAETHDGPLGGGVVITGSIVLVAHTRILLGKEEAV
ncbi:MAG TPA: folylpolyglutamate synthase/dihydrofolate synthase family protein [Actinomycetales bacterium]|nr:folylpolyglutamate synthase/dihydrofolate synthase family protein [Actinomycetales bacterium]